MGDLVDLDERRDRPSEADLAALPCFHFEPAAPATYFAAERLVRALPEARWRPVLLPVEARPDQHGLALRHAAIDRAEALGLPFTSLPATATPSRRAARAAAAAVEAGGGASFAIALCRLIFCGGFDPDDPAVLAEAAAAAGVDPRLVLRAAVEPGRDAALVAAGRELLAAGAERFPVVTVGGRVFDGEERLVEAVALARRGAADAAAADGQAARRR